MALSALADRLMHVDSLSTLTHMLASSVHVLSVHWISNIVMSIIDAHYFDITEAQKSSLRGSLVDILIHRQDWFCQFPGDGPAHTFALHAFCKLLTHVCVLDWVYHPERLQTDDSTLKNRFATKPAPSMTNDVSTKEIDANRIDKVAHNLIKLDPTQNSTLVGMIVLFHLIESMYSTNMSSGKFILLDMFTWSLFVLEKLCLVSDANTLESASYQCLVSSTLDLLLRVLNYNFICTVDEELGTVFVPVSWSSTLLTIDQYGLRSLINFYQYSVRMNQTSSTTKTIEILSYFVSMQSCVFGTKDQQLVVLEILFEHLGNLLTTRMGLYPNSQHASPIDHDNHRMSMNTLVNNSMMLCRVFIRMYNNFDGNMMISSQLWQPLIELLFQFHMDLLQSPACDANMIYYIFLFWSRWFPLEKILESVNIVAIIPTLVSTFIHTQLSRFTQEAQESGDDNDLLNDVQWQPILTLLSKLMHKKTRKLILNPLIALLYDYGTQFMSSKPITIDYPYNSDNVHNNANPQSTLSVVARQLAFLAYLANTFYRGKVYHYVVKLTSDTSSTTNAWNEAQQQESQSMHTIDGDEVKTHEKSITLDIDIVCCLLHILQLHDEKMTTYGQYEASHCVEQAMMVFLQNMVGEYFDLTNPDTLLHQQLQKQFGFETKEVVLQVVLSKITMNFKYWADDVQLSYQTLQLFLRLVGDEQVCRIAAESDLVTHLLTHHTELNLGTNMRNRREFYRVLSALVFVDDQVDKLFAFLSPFDEKLKQLSHQLKEMESPHRDGEYDRPWVEEFLITLNELRGVIMACSSSIMYEIIFDWFYQSNYYQSVCIAALHQFAQVDLRVMWSIARLCQQMIHTKQKQPTQLYKLNANAHDLFKQTAHLLVVMASNIMEASTYTHHHQASQTAHRMHTNSMSTEQQHCHSKTLMLFLSLLTTLLNGAHEFTSISLFAIYDAKIVNDLFAAAFAVIGQFDMNQAKGNQKLMLALYESLSCICRHHLGELFAVDFNTSQDTLGKVLQWLKIGLNIKFKQVNVNAITCIMWISVYQHAIDQRRGRFMNHVNIIDSHHLNILSTIMFYLLDKIVMDSTTDAIAFETLFFMVQWLPDMFHNLKSTIIDSQHDDAEMMSTLQAHFDQLTAVVQPNLNSKNKKKFIYNVRTMSVACEGKLISNPSYTQLRDNYT